ncbi:MAG TPA: arylamine N-acetyltransferase [Bryobacteraceae bacterium]|jgi:arylamine N-acetyltransferase|nr:arylamine N-acetyltransferase [Bryobacteraceae bacterium]
MPTLPEPFPRYLRLLGIDGRPSGIEGLRSIVRRHLFRAPFENISKLCLFGSEGAGRFVSIDEFLDRIEHQDLGGTCHACNPFLAVLLRALGYDADLLGADMPPRVNCHTCLRVRIDSVAYHVDVGYGGPFREPMRLDRLPFEFVEGAGRYVFDRNPNGDGYEMAVFSGEKRVHGYVLKDDTPRTLEFFTPSMRNSFETAAPFLNCIRICRTFEDHSIELLDRSLSIHRGTETTVSELKTQAEWDIAVGNHLAMPKCPSERAIQVLERVTGKAFFEDRGSQPS